MSSTPYNIDADQEFFQFTLQGHIYNFRHMNTDEISAMAEIKDDPKKMLDYLYSFISTDDKEAPAFKDIAPKLIAPQWKKFRQMIETEFGV